MNITKSTIKKSICAMLTLFLFFLSSIGLLNILSRQPVFAYTTDNAKALTIENANFNANTKNEYPFAPSAFTLCDPTFNSISQDNLNVEAGVINIENTTIKRNPLSEDNYVLKLGSKNHAYIGYTTESTITLNADSYYLVSVDVYTDNTNGVANIYLVDDKEVFANISNINSYNNWTTYTFFVKTADESKNLNLGLYINGIGEVYYDNISAYELNSKEYTNRINSLSNSTKNVTDLTEGKVLDIRTMSDSTLYQTDFETGKGSAEYSYAHIADSTNKEASDRTHDTAFRLVNREKTFAEYSTKADYFTFKQNRVYKITISAKTLNLSGRAILSLVETDKDGKNVENAKNNLSQTITSNTSNALTNNYQNYSFYINSSPLESKTYRLKVALGDDTNKTSGELYISSVTISETTYANFESGPDSNKTNLATSLIPSNSAIMLNNGNFNGIKINDSTNPYPATPLNWDVTVGTNQQYYGVINTSQFEDLNKSNYTNLVNPESIQNNSINNNILMMYNSTKDTLVYKSEVKKLEKKTYHKFTLDIQTQNAPAKISLVSTKDQTEVTLTTLTINTYYTWENVQLFIYTGYQTCDVALKIELTSNNYAYAYLDNAYFDYNMSSTDRTDATDFNNALVSDTLVKVKLDNLLNSSDNTDFAKTDLFSSEKVIMGTISMNSPTLTSNILANKEFLEEFKLVSGEKILGVRALDMGNYKVGSNIGYTLTANNYYKFVVSIYTQNLQSEDEEDSAVELLLTGFDKSFKKISTERRDEDGNLISNGWQTYTFYINPTADTTTYLELNLGSSLTKAKGDIFIGGIEFIDEGLSEADFKNISDTDNTLLLQTTTNKDEEEKPNDTDNNTNNNAWIYAIPTILFALAIVIAIVGVLIRKIKWRKPKKKSKTEYDRNRTVSKQVYMRKATSMRESKLRELSKELETLSQERQTYEESYKQDLTKLREMKIKRVDSKEIAKLEKEMKKNQKLSANIGLSISRIENDIEYVKSESYLNSLMKKLENEKFTENNSSENKKNED